MKKTPSLGLGALIIVTSYIAAQMLADIASLKIALLGSFAIDGGTFIYPITFTLRDLVHKKLGKKVARQLIVVAACINLFMAGYLWFVSQLTPDPAWGLQEEFSAILAPVWRIVLASIVAEVVSELIDTEAYSFFINKISKRYQWGRVLFSNAIAIPIDSFLFVFIAFSGVLPSEVVWSIFWTNIYVKGGVTLLSLPLIYAVKEKKA